MANIFGTLINAVNTATDPNARDAALHKFSSELQQAITRGGDIRLLLEDALRGVPPGAVVLGPASMLAIGEVQRYLANVATGAVTMTPQTLSAMIALLVNVFGGGGGGMPGLPGLPGLLGLPQLPGLPFQIPQIPGLDACMFIKCLASSMDCSGATGGGMPGTGGGDDPIGRMVGSGIEALKRARDMAEEKFRQAEQTAKDLAVAANVATGVARNEIEAAKKRAEADAKELREKSEQLGQTIGGAIAHGWPRG